MGLSLNDKKAFAKRRKEAAKQSQRFHKEQEKRAKKSSEKSKKASPKKRSASKIENAVNSGKTAKFEKISREEKFRREGEERIRNLKPHDFEDGYYIDEYSERQRQERRARIIRKQEKEVIRRNKKPMTSKQVRTRRILLTSAIFLAVLVIGAILSLTVLFKTEKIEVEGCTVYYDEQIIGFSNVSYQQNIFLGKLNSTPEKIVENLAYVEEADIRFSVPDTITISITEATPTYVIKDGNNYLLISAKGRILNSITENSDQYTELICGDFSGREIGSYVEFSDASVPEILESVADSLKNNGVDKIVGFDVTDVSAITLDYDHRIKINIGIAEDIDYKIKTAMAIITQKLDPNNLGQVYGTLDVSTCSKNKMSHYKPAESAPSTTAAPTTVPATESAAQDNGSSAGEIIWDEYGYYDEDGIFHEYTYEDSEDYQSYDDTYDGNSEDYPGDDGYTWEDGSYESYGGEWNDGYSDDSGDAVE